MPSKHFLNKSRGCFVTAFLAMTVFLYSISIALSLYRSISPTPVQAQAQPAFQEIQPKIVIPVPTLTPFTPIAQPDSSGRIAVRYLGEYIEGIYRYAVGIAGIFAVALIMWGGMKWVFAGGDPTKLGTAKKTISNAVIGLVLALGSYLLLYTINPETVSFKALKLALIPQIMYEEAGDSNEQEVDPRAPDLATYLQQIGIFCPKSGGSIALQEIAESFKGKVSYRYGGKGKFNPPFDWREELLGSTWLEFDRNCPQNAICLDCSGFIGMVHRCAGFSSPGGGSGGMLNNAEQIVQGIDFSTLNVNGIPLNPGDILGWTKEDEPITKKRVGHVVLYIGNDMFAESHGGRESRIGPNAIRIAGASRYQTYPFTRIKRAPQ